MRFGRANVTVKYRRSNSMKKNARKPFDREDRVAFAVAGVLAIVYGYEEILRSSPIYTTWLGQDTTASIPILLGVLALVAAVLPWGHIQDFWNSRKKKNYR
jgi:hypothetical protein